MAEEAHITQTQSSSSKKKATGQFTHWARPRWIRMYEYNYNFGESYYRPQVRYVSSSKTASSMEYSSRSSSVAAADASSSLSSRARYTYKRRLTSPPKAMTFIERWSAEPFYGLHGGFVSRRSSSVARDYNNSASYDNYNYNARSQRESSQLRSSMSMARGESMEREETSQAQYRSNLRSRREVDSAEREMSEMRYSRAPSEMRSRRDMFEYNTRHRIDGTSNYASSTLLDQIKSVRATSAALQAESDIVQLRLRERRARSLEALRRAEMDGYAYSAQGASDDCLMRSNAMLGEFDYDAANRTRRAQSVLSDIEARYAREGSLTRSTLAVDENNILHGRTLDDAYHYDYPRHHLVCTEKCPLYTDPEYHRRFVIGNKFVDAAALGGFDVLYDPTVYKKTRNLLSRLSEERDVDTTLYESTRASSMERSRSRSRYAYNTIY